MRVSHGWGSVRPTAMAGRHSSEIRTGCANQRPSGSEEGVVSNHGPYSDANCADPMSWGNGESGETKANLSIPPNFASFMFDPAYNARPHFHFRPPDFFSEVNIVSSAVIPQAPASVRPFGESNVIIAIKPPFEPSSR